MIFFFLISPVVSHSKTNKELYSTSDPVYFTYGIWLSAKPPFSRLPSFPGWISRDLSPLTQLAGGLVLEFLPQIGFLHKIAHFPSGFIQESENYAKLWLLWYYVVYGAPQ